MKSPIARLVVSGAMPGEDLRSLAGFLAKMRDAGFLVFVRSRVGDPDIYDRLHKEHTEAIIQQADLEERTSNGAGRKKT